MEANGNLAEKDRGKISKNQQASKHGGARPNAGGSRMGAGRKPGVPNKLSGDLKAMILDALGKEGGIEYLRQVAQEDRKAFCSLLGRVLPMTVQGDPENPLQVEHSRIEFVVVTPPKSS